MYIHLILENRVMRRKPSRPVTLNLSTMMHSEIASKSLHCYLLPLWTFLKMLIYIDCHTRCTTIHALSMHHYPPAELQFVQLHAHHGTPMKSTLKRGKEESLKGNGGKVDSHRIVYGSLNNAD